MSEKTISRYATLRYTLSRCGREGRVCDCRGIKQDCRFWTIWSWSGSYAQFVTILKLWLWNFNSFCGSVADPDPNPDPPDPHVFGPPGSGSGSFYHHAKIVRKSLIPTILWLFLTFYLWKMMLKNSFLLASWRSMTKISGSGSRIRIRIH